MFHSSRQVRKLALAPAVAVALVAALPAHAETAAEAASAEPVPLAIRYAAKPDEGNQAQFAKLFREWRSVDRTAAAPPYEAALSRAPAVAAGSRALGRTLRAPMAGFAMTSGFGMRLHPLLGGWRPHLGVDLAARMGTPVHATADGVVGMAGARGGYGLSVALEHGGGMETRYGHMSRLNVAAGQRVRKGDVIGFVGSTGLSTGPHLHYETRINGKPVNPLPYMRTP